MRTFDDHIAFDDLAIHEDMIADSVRMDAYHAAIERYVTPQDDVVDVGTGTGILAFLAAKHAHKTYAIDKSISILKYARFVAKFNNINSVGFIRTSSYRFNKPVDVIIHDQMGPGLFDEGMVKTIIDVRDRCLKPGGRILPANFELYIEPVQLIDQERIPMIQEQKPYGLSFPAPQTYQLREVYPRDIEFLFCRPKPVFSFDLNTLTLDQLPKQIISKKPVTRSGQLDGVCVYFKAVFDDYISFCTGPLFPKTHWPMLLYRTPAYLCTTGEIFQMHINIPDVSKLYNWTWRVSLDINT